MPITTSEQKLLFTLKTLVETERKTLTAILEHLQKVYDTRLFAKLGYSSIHKYLIKELGYSESAAFRRVQALKLVKEVPKTKKMIEQGELNLSNITQIQTILNDKDTNVKEEAVEKVKNTSSAEAKNTLFDLAPEKQRIPKDHRRKISKNHTRLSITLSTTTMDKLNLVKAKTKKYNHDDLLSYLLDLALNHNEKQTRKSKGSTNPRTIPAAVKREVYKRAKGRCEHPNCNEIHYLEYDHITPVALGGSNHLTNIRLVCKAHNQLYAIEKFGINKMQRFIA